MPKNHPDLTAARLRELLSYDPKTGIFRWRKARGKRQAGAVAGVYTEKGYCRIGIDYVNHYGHRLAWLYVHGQWPAEEIDHKNGVRSENWIKNLREATHAQNGQNIAMSRRNKSGAVGVIWSKKKKTWGAQIQVGGIHHWLGYFETVDAASEAYSKAKAKFHPFQPVIR